MGSGIKLKGVAEDEMLVMCRCFEMAIKHLFM